MKISTERWAAIALIAMAASWGSTFFLIHDLVKRVPVLDFLGVRFLIATVFLLLIAPKALQKLAGVQVKRAVLLGICYGVAQILQTWGLKTASASVSGFITGMYVVGTPILAIWLLRDRPHGKLPRATWIAVLCAVLGLGVLTLAPGSFGFQSGEILTLIAAMIYAVHIIGLSVWSTPKDAIGMTIVQLIVITVICLLAAGIPDGIQFAQTNLDWWIVIYMAIIPGALAVLGQTWAQAHLPPTTSAIIMSLEPVFAAFFAVIAGQESISLRLLAGGMLMLIAMLLVEVKPASLTKLKLGLIKARAN